MLGGKTATMIIIITQDIEEVSLRTGTTLNEVAANQLRHLPVPHILRRRLGEESIDYLRTANVPQLIVSALRGGIMVWIVYVTSGGIEMMHGTEATEIVDIQKKIADIILEGTKTEIETRIETGIIKVRKTAIGDQEPRAREMITTAAMSTTIVMQDVAQTVIDPPRLVLPAVIHLQHIHLALHHHLIP